jgi:hypothetical protein
MATMLEPLPEPRTPMRFLGPDDTQALFQEPGRVARKMLKALDRCPGMTFANTFRKQYLPGFHVAINNQRQIGFGGRQFGRTFQNDKITAHLRDAV